MSTLIVKAGDRVRVTWEVTSKGGDEDSSGHILICNSGARGGSAYVPASCVEVLAQPVRVGDIVAQSKFHDEVDLPVGSVVIGTASKVRHFRTNVGWQSADTSLPDLEFTSGFYEVEFIPEVAA